MKKIKYKWEMIIKIKVYWAKIKIKKYQKCGKKCTFPLVINADPQQFPREDESFNEQRPMGHTDRGWDV